MALDIDDLGTILTVWAHPDDETYLAGALMASAVARGQRVVCVTATLGERGTDDPVAWPPERLARLREWEATAAMAILGVRDHRVLGLPDGGLAEMDDVGLPAVAAVIDEVRPDTVVTFGPEGMTFHPDHIAVHRWVTGAWSARGRGRLLYATQTAERLARFRERYETWGMYMTDERPAGVPEADLALHLRTGGATLDRKIAALRAMASQTAGLVAMMGADSFAEQVADEAFVDARHAGAAAPTTRPTATASVTG